MRSPDPLLAVLSVFRAAELLVRSYKVRSSETGLRVEEESSHDLCRISLETLLTTSTAATDFCLMAPPQAAQMPTWFSTAAHK